MRDKLLEIQFMKRIGQVWFEFFVSNSWKWNANVIIVCQRKLIFSLELFMITNCFYVRWSNSMWMEFCRIFYIPVPFVTSKSPTKLNKFTYTICNLSSSGRECIPEQILCKILSGNRKEEIKCFLGNRKNSFICLFMEFFSEVKYFGKHDFLIFYKPSQTDMTTPSICLHPR